MSFLSCKLKDAVELAYGKALPERIRKDGEIPVYGSGGIGGYHNESIVTGPGVIVGRKGTIGSVFYEKSDFYPIDTVYYVKTNPQKIGIRFAYYLLKNLNLSSLNSDAAVPGLNRDRAYDLTIKLPDVKTQSNILQILEKYDDLIENNRRRIQLLEDAARLLYREWFIYLRFPGHEHVKIVDGVPEGWLSKRLGEILTLNYGKALKAETRISGPYPVYGSSGIVGTHETALVTGPSIIIGRKGNVGSIYWASKNSYPIDTVYFINTEQSNLYLYYALQYVQFINTDVAVPGLNRDMAYSRHLLIPSETILQSFIDQAQTIRQQIEKLAEFNTKLTDARDLLLPRLMSGEISV
jgi:type I restriction enzyme S subunit